MSEAVKNLFAAISPTYDRLNHLLSLNIDKIWRKRAMALIDQPQEASFRALDLCAGTLDLTLACLARFPQAQIIALDFSEKMLEQGLKKLTPPLRDHVTVLCADALHTPMKEASADVIISGYGVRNLDDLKKGIQEMHRVLKPHGQLVVLDFFKPVTLPAKIFQATYGRFIIPFMGRLISHHSMAYEYLRNSIAGFVTAAEFADLLQKRGFAHTRIKNFALSISSVVTAVKI